MSDSQERDSKYNLERLRDYLIQQEMYDTQLEKVIFIVHQYKEKFLMKAINILGYILQFLDIYIENNAATDFYQMLTKFAIDRFKTDKNTQEKAKKFLTILIYSLKYYSQSSKELEFLYKMLLLGDQIQIKTIKIYLKIRKIIFQYYSQGRLNISLLDDISLQFDTWSTIASRVFSSASIYELGQTVRENNMQTRINDKSKDNSVNALVFVKICLSYHNKNPHNDRQLSPLQSPQQNKKVEQINMQRSQELSNNNVEKTLKKSKSIIQIKSIKDMVKIGSLVTRSATPEKRSATPEKKQIEQKNSVIQKSLHNQFTFRTPKNDQNQKIKHNSQNCEKVRESVQQNISQNLSAKQVINSSNNESNNSNSIAQKQLQTLSQQYNTLSSYTKELQMLFNVFLQKNKQGVQLNNTDINHIQNLLTFNNYAENSSQIIQNIK